MKNKPAVFITRKIPSAALQKLMPYANIEVWQDENPPSLETLLQKASEIDGIFTLLTDSINSMVIERFKPSFKVISQMSVGFDNIDIGAASKRGIPVGHTPGVLTETTADFTWALLMASARRIVEGNNEVHQGIWRPWGPEVLLGVDLYGATLGIIGFGRIGQAVARRAIGFNMKVLYHDPNRNTELEQSLGVIYSNLDELITLSDFITVHTFLSKDTHHLINRAILEKMKTTAILINTSRGPIVSPDDLTWALTEGRIAGAALDVFEPEPIPEGHPLLQMKNVIITPHIASASVQTRTLMALMAADNLIAGLKEEQLPYCANPRVYSV
jgi:glyoxylate reductase